MHRSAQLDFSSPLRVIRDRIGPVTNATTSAIA
jgi:hypothetical protein